VFALLCAVRAESRCIAGILGDARRDSINNLIVWTGSYAGRPALLAQTGMGPKVAEGAAHRIMAAYPVKRLVSFGFAGALHPQLAVGDLVIYRQLWMAGAPVRTPDEDWYTRAQAMASRLGSPVHCLDGVTVEQVVSDPFMKRALAAAYPAQAVDMESYVLAQAAAEHNVPFLAVRAISDTVDERLPPLQRWSATGGWRSAAHDMIAHPEHLAALIRLASNVRRAQQSLGAFFRSGQEETALWN
jgi:adenosylhomocysteine nucleosidase